RDYGGFDDFLGSLSSRNRKKLRAERHAVHAQGIRTEVLAGDAVSPEVWDLFHQFYLSTFIRKGNFAPLTRGFFRELGASLGDRTLLILATHQDRYVAGAFFFRGTD